MSKGSSVLTAAGLICRGCPGTESEVREIYHTDDLIGEGRIQEHLVETWARITGCWHESIFASMDKHSIIMEVNLIASLLDSMTGLCPKSVTDLFTFETGVHNKKEELIESALEWHRKELAEKCRHVEDGHLFNFFDLWNRYSGIGETVHSRLIHFLLYPDALHGQGRRYLDIFLAKLKISNPSDGIWTITAEKGRVDVRLTRCNPRSVILIENKSNGAIDQNNQLYRYWYQNIHRCKEDCFQGYYTNTDYRIVYLVSKQAKTISEDSLKKPPKEWFAQGNEYDELPERIPLYPIKWTFADEISQWIKDCINATPVVNYPLQSYLSQYMDYCKRI